ncbi:MAG: carbamoyl phosphate synthase large subunit [Planctomycetes bacterium RBG_16_43_13]|nr:MAG: carbamoyl phosphate synthase large subunit [Planctomycetes bacterium RBG_16_43_13]
MPKRNDIKKILLIGSGPIVIGQACEFDYSGTQAVKALKEEGYKIVLINSNPATIMTDPEFADRTYIEPVTAEFIAKIIEKERPDAVLPTVGGQTALNCAVQLADEGVLTKFGVSMIGATADVIKKAEDRKLFKKAMEKIHLDLPKSGYAYSLKDAQEVARKIGLPCVIRPSFTLGGTGGGIAYNGEEFERIVAFGLQQSMIKEVLIEESVYGWKEYELEVMRDKKDNIVIVCSIENFDPMGIHTGDSITVAPAQTLTDREYQKMRDAAIMIMREIGVETGGSNIQFAVNPRDGRMVVIEMNPRVSRSSALASKATGFPIAKIAAKLAVGYTLDEIPNDITRKTPACFEPTIDYCVVKTPRWAFEKFPEADASLGIQMKSVGETMSIGRTFKEALQKSIRSLEQGRFGLGWDRKDLLLKDTPLPKDKIIEKLITPNVDRLFYIRYALKAGISVEEIVSHSKVDLWFVENISEIVRFEETLMECETIDATSRDTFLEAKKLGFSDVQLGNIFSATPQLIRQQRKKQGIVPVYKLVDTCAAEFEAYTPYYYSTYEEESEVRVSDKKKIVILGGGPNRIGQGIEFDYCCVHASFALRELGYESIMINSNPETVSTDYDISDQLYFEPLTEEDVLNICDVLKPEGVIVQLGGQTPLNLASGLAKAGVKIIGTSVEQIDRAEDRKKFNELISKLQLVQATGGTATNFGEAKKCANIIGYPVLVRPSYVLGGRAMRIVYDDSELEHYIKEAVDASPDHPVLIDKFLEDAIEVDVDAVSDGVDVLIGGVLEHIEMAGVHSGDAAMSIPPFSLSDSQLDTIRKNTVALAKELEVKGLMNVQFAVKANTVYILEVNPRASRTVPFVSKAIGVPLAKIATNVMLGNRLKDVLAKYKIPQKMDSDLRHFSVKESVFPFRRFPGTDIILGPEMKSTGEVMGIDVDFGRAYAKAEIAASHNLPTSGNVFISVKDSDKRDIIYIAKKLQDMGFKIYATSGTSRVLVRNGIDVKALYKIKEGRPNPADLIINGEIDLIINTPSGKGPKTDEAHIRSIAVAHGITVITTISAAQAAVNGIEAMRSGELGVKPLQEYH